MDKIYLSKPEIEALEKEPDGTIAGTVTRLMEHGWQLPAIYNRLRSLFYEPVPVVGVVPVADALIECSCCPKWLWLTDSWAPGDEALCSECNREVTGRWKQASIDPSKFPPDCESDTEPLEFAPGPPTESYQESCDRHFWETIGGINRHPYED